MISEELKKAIEKRDSKVASAAKGRKAGYSFSDLLGKTGMEANKLRGSLRRLREQGKVRVTGALRAMKYTAA